MTRNTTLPGTNDAPHERAGDLIPGNMLAPGLLLPGPTEVLAVLPFDDADHGPSVTVMYPGPLGKPQPWDTGADVMLPLATPGQIAEHRESGVRAQKIADLRAFADFLDANPWAPMPYTASLLAHIHPDGTGLWENGAEAVDRVRAIADRLGVQVDESLDDRTTTVRKFGSVEYRVIAWHKAGRPVQSEPEEHVDPVGQGYSRGDEGEDPQPAAGRVPARFENVTDPVVWHFSFGHGQTDPLDGKGLLDHYVTVVAPTVQICREVMLASRFGQAWSFDYAPDSPTWMEWGPRWTEHERITVTALASGHLSPPSTTAPIGDACAFDADGMCTAHGAHHDDPGSADTP